MTVQFQHDQRGSAGAVGCRCTCDRRDHASRVALVWRVRREFEELPGLRLTRPQAGRLFGLRNDICVRILDELVRDHVLWAADDGRYGTCCH